MSLTPTFSPKVPEWRGNTSSEDMNENFDEILYDLNTIFSEASKIVIDLNEIESRIRHDMDSLGSRVYAVSGLISAYEQAQTGYKMFYEEFYMPTQVAYPSNVTDQNKCSVNSEFGVVTLPVNNSFSKVYTVNIADGETIVAPDLIAVSESVDEVGSVRVDETAIERAFDGRDDSVWERKVRYERDSAKSESRCVVNITLPSMNNPYVNKLHIKPYPEGTEDVEQITYDTMVTQDTVLPSFPVDGENNINSKMYSFNDIQPTKLKVYFRQRVSNVEDDFKTFVSGAKEIGIERVEYSPSGKVGMKFTIPEYDTGLLSSITSFKTFPEYDNITIKANIYPSEAEFNTDIPMWTSSNSPITTDNPLDVAVYGMDSIWVAIELIQSQGDTKTPTVQSVTMTYTTTEI
jgi:hypothetical protein